MQFEEYLEKSQEEINGCLEKIFSKDDKFIKNIRYSLTGKKFRPTLVLLSHDALGGKNRKEALDYAATIELIHSSSLVHDDILDWDYERRGKKSLHIYLKSARQAVFTGDGMLAKAWTLLRTPEAVKTVGDGVFALFRGATMEVMHPLETSSYMKYLDIVILKTASLFATSMFLGSIAARAPREQKEAMRQYGKALGIAFQISDDQADKQLPKTIKTPLKEIEKWQGKALTQLDKIPDSEYRDLLAECPFFMVERMLKEG